MNGKCGFSGISKTTLTSRNEGDIIMEWQFNHTTISIIVATAILTTLIIIIDAVLLFRKRRTGIPGSLGTFIDSILLLSGLLPLIAFYSVYKVFFIISSHGNAKQFISLFIPNIVVVKVCGTLFVIFFYAWVILRILYNRFRVNKVY